MSHRLHSTITRGVISADLFDVAVVERVEGELDRTIEKRAAQADEHRRIEAAWAESERRYRDRRWEENAAAWRSYHLDQAERLEQTAAELGEVVLRPDHTLTNQSSEEGGYMLNTTNGPVEKELHRINTSRVVDEDLLYEDEPPEILAVLPGGVWHARIGDEAGDVEKHSGFVRYEQINNNDKEQ